MSQVSCYVLKWALKVKMQVILEHKGESHNPTLGGDGVRGVFLEYRNQILKYGLGKKSQTLIQTNLGNSVLLPF